MECKDFIEAELLILIPVIYIIGIVLKKSKMPDKRIPLTLGAVSIFLCAVWIIATNDIGSIKQAAYALFTAVTQGILVVGAGVYANQLYIQAKKEE